MYQLVIRGDALKSSAVVAYADVPKLVLDDRQLLAVARREDVVQERRLAAPKKTWGICTRRAGKLYRARSRLYRSQSLQPNIRWKALAEIYTMHSFAPFWNPYAKNGGKRAWPKPFSWDPSGFSNLNFFVKNC